MKHFSNVNVISQDIDGCIDTEKKMFPLAEKNCCGNFTIYFGEFRVLDATEKESIERLSNKIKELELKQFYLNTGRSLSFALSIAEEFQKYLPNDIFRYILCESGGVIYDLKEKKKLDILGILRKNLAFQLEKLYFHEIEKMKQIKNWIENGGGKEVIDNLSEYFNVSRDEFYFSVWDCSFNFFHPKNLEREDVIERLRYFFNKNKKEGLELAELIIYPSQFCIDIVSYLSKGMGLEAILIHQGFDVSELIHIGDGSNDLSAMGYARFCAAPWNANDLVKIISYFRGAVSKKKHHDGIMDLYGMIYEEKTSHHR